MFSKKAEKIYKKYKPVVAPGLLIFIIITLPYKYYPLITTKILHTGSLLSPNNNLFFDLTVFKLATMCFVWFSVLTVLASVYSFLKEKQEKQLFVAMVIVLILVTYIFSLNPDLTGIEKSLSH